MSVSQRHQPLSVEARGANQASKVIGSLRSSRSEIRRWPGAAYLAGPAIHCQTLKVIGLLRNLAPRAWRILRSERAQLMQRRCLTP